MNREERKELATKLKPKRLALGHTQTECAKAMGLSCKVTVCKLEKGFNPPSPLVAMAIKKYLKRKC